MLLMSYRRNQQLRRAGERARRGRSSSAAVRGLPVVPRPRTPPAPTRPVPVRRTAAEAGEGSQLDTPQTGGLDWARRIELVAVVLGVLLSPLIAAAGIWYSNHQVRDQLKISSQELGVSREGQITDRYTKAVENLGDDAMDVRLGGVYALQRIMEDSPRDHPTIANVLATYVRTHANRTSEEGEGEPADVHAALAVLAHRNSARDKSFRLDLRGARLPGIELGSLQDGGKPVDLSGAVLSGADLSGAVLYGANLTRVFLPGVNLSDALLDGADLTDADMSGANLTNAALSNANLTGASLLGADLIDAHLLGADLTDAHLLGADLAGTLLKPSQVVSAVIDSTTRLPSELARHPEVRAHIAEMNQAVEDHR
jgi:hypothetical protein